MMRPYTGATDPAKAARPGLKKCQEWMTFLFGMKSLGMYANRTVRGGKGLSVHATGRAADLGGTAEQVKETIGFLYRFRNDLQVEAIHDYRGVWIPTRGFGAAYRCNREKGGLLSGWTVYNKPTIGSGGLWTHYELSPAVASSSDRVDQTFTLILEQLAKEPRQ